MRTITENFDIILARQQSIGHDYRSVLNPPANIDDITKVENRLDIKFPAELLELYAFANGEKCGTWKSFFPNYEFLDLDNAEETYLFCDNLFDIKTNPEYFTIYDYNYNPIYIPQRKMFPFFASDNGNLYWVDLNENTKHYNKILWTCVDGAPIYEFNSLTSMFQTIAECYEHNLFSLTTNNRLDYDIKQWGVIGKKYNAGLTIWNNFIKHNK